MFNLIACRCKDDSVDTVMSYDEYGLPYVETASIESKTTVLLLATIAPEPLAKCADSENNGRLYLMEWV